VRSRNLENEEAKARYWAVTIQPQWVVTPGKQTNKGKGKGKGHPIIGHEGPEVE
jgi:hypothetical protein